MHPRALRLKGTNEITRLKIGQVNRSYVMREISSLAEELFVVQ